MTAADPLLPLLEPGTAVDLDNCAQEPIHIPGSIQPRGVLLAVSEPDLTIHQVSANLADLTGVEVADALGRTLSEALGPLFAATIEQATGVFGDLQERNPLAIVLDVKGESTRFDAVLHRSSDATLLVELEPSHGPRPFSFPNTYLAVRGAVAELNQAASLEELYGITAAAVRQLTGFDRVMVYRYDHEFNGEVVAENKRNDLEPFLGLHYPASDIPAQARALYEKNWIRLISDVDYQPAALVPDLAPSTGHSLDLTLSTLRSVSPIHVEYLRNMGVRASMSISLLRHGTLWGLIACHHYSGPHDPPYGVRAAAEFLGSTLSLRLVDRAEETELRTALQAQSVLAKLVAAMLNEDEPLNTALLDEPGLLDLFPADGVAVMVADQLGVLGTVPNPSMLQMVAAWARSTGDDLVATDSLSLSAPRLNASPSEASGVLALSLPEGQYVLWFRGEAPSAIDWGGDPHNKAIQAAEAENVRLSPRKSFERWREVVRLHSQPWTAEQRHLASELRALLVEALYTRSQRGLRLAETLQRSLLPDSLPTVAGWTVTAHYETAQGGQVGGDWYDALVVSDDTLILVLGDVAGHGVAAAGTMAQLRNALRAYLLRSASPSDALASLNQFATALLPAAFATVLVAYIDTSTGNVRAASAGHPRPYLATPGDRTVATHLEISPPIGVPGASYASSDFTIGSGAGLILFSDGLVERRTENLEFSLTQLSCALDRLEPDTGASEIFAATTKPDAYDDTTVIALYRHQQVADRQEHPPASGG